MATVRLTCAMYLGKFLEGKGDVAEEGQWRSVVELRLQFIIAL